MDAVLGNISSSSLCIPSSQRTRLFMRHKALIAQTACRCSLSRISSNVKFNHRRRKYSSLVCNFFGPSTPSDVKNSATDAHIKDAESVRNDDVDRPPFDLNLAVVLAGFAFEAYNTPPDKIGVREVNASECMTVFLSEHFLHQVYDGKLLVKLKRGLDLPAMDPWGTSDPYVVISLGDSIVKSKTLWATKEPCWNETFEINVKEPGQNFLKISVWDANIVAPHKLMGNGGVKLEALCDGNVHEVQVELEGIAGGGKVDIEIRYTSFEELKTREAGWKLPFLSDIILANGLESALKGVFGTDSMKAREFVNSAFGQMQHFLELANLDNNGKSKDESNSQKTETDKPSALPNASNQNTFQTLNHDIDDKGNQNVNHINSNSELDFWKALANNINHKMESFGLPALSNFSWNANDMITKLGLQSQNMAEQQYVGTGLATPKEDDGVQSTVAAEANGSSFSLDDFKQASGDVLRQTESILGSLIMISSSITKQKGQSMENGEGKTSNATAVVIENVPCSFNADSDITKSEAELLDDKRLEEMKKMFETAESAMEAWAMLATALGRGSFIKSEFEKICFLDNERTDTQVAVWRDNSQKRLVVAFRGTEQVRWKDLRTDLMMAPAGINPERIGGDFKEEVQVHSGFLNAYDSVRDRLISIIKAAVSFRNEKKKDNQSSWHIFVTGHSLGGALATLLSLELSSSQMAKCGLIKITMYNFGSPRVGNKKFAEEYNKRVKDSWRVVNHRDIIPTVPRLMGYCHVAQPIYLTAGDLRDATAGLEVLEDAHDGVTIGEFTPDVLVSGFMKGEKKLIDKLLQTEINLFRAIRDGTALMQHMEDFYYITLLQSVRSKYLKQ